MVSNWFGFDYILVLDLRNMKKILLEGFVYYKCIYIIVEKFFYIFYN